MKIENWCYGMTIEEIEQKDKEIKQEQDKLQKELEKLEKEKSLIKREAELTKQKRSKFPPGFPLRWNHSDPPFESWWELKLKGSDEYWVVKDTKEAHIQALEFAWKLVDQSNITQRNINKAIEEMTGA